MAVTNCSPTVVLGLEIPTGRYMTGRQGKAKAGYADASNCTPEPPHTPPPLL